MSDAQERNRKRRGHHRKFMDSLEIVRDAKKIKNIRRAQGIYNPEDTEKYGQEYERAFGHAGAKTDGSGTWKWDAKQKKLVKVSDKVPNGRLISL
jgi:hypothetical protein